MLDSPLIVTTKLLVPPRRPELLHRPRLVDFLHEHIDRKLIVISAPAGYGKSSLLVDFAHEADVPICWYALDPYDADPRIFLDHLVASIRRQFPDFGQRTRAALHSGGDVRSNLYPLTAVMANEIYEISDYFVVVLDDFHRVDASEPINDFLSLLLRYVEENCHLIVASRTLPAIPDQALMAARGQMVGLSAEELKFIPAEIQALAQQNYGLSIPYERAEELARYSDGWITGILLTAHQATWQKILEGAVRLPEASGRVYGYLAEQVLNLQPPALQQFLLESAVLEEMTPARCDELLGRHDSAQFLEQIVQKNLFIAPTGDDAYAYHYLFRDFLRGRLRRADPERHRALYVRAAQNYAARGEWERAVTAYLEPGLYEEAAQAIEAAERPFFDAGRWDLLVGWLDTLPRPLFLARPRLMSLRGRIHAERGEMEFALELYGRCLQEFRRQGDTTQEVRTLLRQAFALRCQGRYAEALACARQAMPLLSRLAEGPERQMLEGGLQDCEGFCHYFLGQPGEAIPHLEEAARLFGAAGDDLGAAHAHHNLGISYRAIGQIGAAMAHYRRALGHWERLGKPGWLANTLNSLGMLYYLQGEWDEAERIYAQALEWARQGGVARLEALILASLGDLQRDRGDYEVALQSYAQGRELAERSWDAFLVAYILQAQGEALQRMGDPERAEAHLAAALQQAERLRSDYLIGLCHLAQGALEADRGRLQLALEALAQAQAALERAGFRHELARTHLYLAHVLSLLGQEKEVLAHLGRVAELAEGLGYDHFLAVDGRHMQVVLRQGAQAGLGGGRFARALEQIRHAPLAPAGAAGMPATPSAAGPALRLHAFGRARVLRGNQEVIPQRELVKELFFYLLAHHPHPVRKEEVLEQLWGGLSPPKADGALRVALYRLRRAICPASAEGGWLALELPPDCWYDVKEFEGALREAREAEGDPQQQIAWCERAIALYEGPYLEQVGSLWALGERERLQREYHAVLLALARLRLMARDYPTAMELYQRAVDQEPYHEEAWQGLLRAQALSGNRAAAMEAFQRLIRLLREDLGVDPGPEIQALYRQILEMQL